MDALAVIESDPATLAAAIERAALTDGSGTGQKMFLRITADAVETPASGAGASRGSYCTLDAERFDRLTLHAATAVDAMFDVDTVLGWLEWFAGDRVAARFEGQSGVASQLTLEAGPETVTVDCEDDPTVLNSVETVLPDRFDGDTFLTDDGAPMATTVETTAAELRRLVRAVGIADAGEAYPLLVRDGRLVADVTGDAATVSAPLAAAVSGPDVTNHYDGGFAHVVDGIEGPVKLQTGPGEAVAFVQERDTYTLRFVVGHG